MTKQEGLIIGAAALVVLLPIGGCGVYRASAKMTEPVCVKSKERVAKRNSSKYLVFTEGEVFEVTDSISFFNWRSSDRYSAVEEGKTYRFRVAGWRIPFLSMYRNILSAEEIAND